MVVVPIFYALVAGILLVFTKWFGFKVSRTTKLLTYGVPHVIAGVVMLRIGRWRSGFVAAIAYAVTSYLVVDGIKKLMGGLEDKITGVISRDERDSPLLPYQGESVIDSTAREGVLHLMRDDDSFLSQGQCGSCAVCVLAQMWRWHGWDEERSYPSTDEIMKQLEGFGIHNICRNGLDPTDLVNVQFTNVKVTSTPWSAHTGYSCTDDPPKLGKKYMVHEGGCAWLHAHYVTCVSKYTGSEWGKDCKAVLKYCRDHYDYDCDAYAAHEAVNLDTYKSIPEKTSGEDIYYSLKHIGGGHLFVETMLDTKTAQIYLTHGPCMVCINADLLEDSKGCGTSEDYTHTYSTPAPPGSKQNHAVLLYDIAKNLATNKMEYLLKNSWGHDASHRFFRVEVGSNALSIERSDPRLVGEANAKFAIGIVAITDHNQLNGSFKGPLPTSSGP